MRTLINAGSSKSQVKQASEATKQLGNTMKRSGVISTWCIWLGFLLCGLAFVCSWVMPEASKSTSSKPASESIPIAIEDVQLGWRVVGENPLGQETFDEEPNEKTWRKVVLNLRSEDGSLVEISYLRSNAWFEKWKAEVGRTIDLALSEPGKSGIATVVAIEPCPEIKNGRGLVVTGVYRHLCLEGELVRVEFAGDLQPIVGTYNHPFWSETRSSFVNAAELEPGEKLLCSDDQIIRVKSVTPLTGVERVFNLETHNQHVYAVGNLGLIVHNMHGEGDDVDLHRLMNKAEVDDLQKTASFNPPPGGNELKSFNLSAKDAQEATRFDHLIRGNEKDGLFLVRARVPKSTAAQLDPTELDNLPTLTVQRDQFELFNTTLEDVEIIGIATRGGD